MPIPSTSAIIELIKTGATIEAQEKIMELRLAALEAQEENIDLRNTVTGLEARIAELENDTGEPCPKCRKKAWVVESSQPHRSLGDLGVINRVYKCSECGFTEEALSTPE